MSREEILTKLQTGVIEGNTEMVKIAANEAVVTRLDPLDAIENGLAKGVRVVGDGFGKGEFFLAELVAAAEAMKVGLEILKPLILQQKKEIKTVGKVVIGTVSGDIHDIGKSIVASLLFAHGFEVIDLGVDVPTEVFVEKVIELKPDILGLSALMTTTMLHQKDVIEALKKAGIRDKVKVMIGGAVVNHEWAMEIGADAWATDALEAVKKAKELCRRTK
ncbi:MAG: B12-binding domain-containing protein [Nitrososphaeria archaeon]